MVSELFNWILKGLTSGFGGYGGSCVWGYKKDFQKVIDYESYLRFAVYGDDVDDFFFLLSTLQMLASSHPHFLWLQQCDQHSFGFTGKCRCWTCDEIDWFQRKSTGHRVFLTAKQKEVSFEVVEGIQMPFHQEKKRFVCGYALQFENIWNIVMITPGNHCCDCFDYWRYIKVTSRHQMNVSFCRSYLHRFLENLYPPLDLR